MKIDKINDLKMKVENFAWIYDKYTGFLSEEERKMYRGIGLSKSSLDKINKSIDHYFMEPDPETTAMQVGSAFHTIILEPEKFHEEYICGPVDCDKRTSAGKKAWNELQEDNPKKVILGVSDWDMIHYMKESLSRHNLASDMLKLDEGYAEETIMWNDEELNTLMKGRTDFRNLSRKAIIDLKSTRPYTLSFLYNQRGCQVNVSS